MPDSICPNCRAQIESSASACPGCGRRRRLFPWRWILALTLVSLVVFVQIQSEKKERTESERIEHLSPEQRAAAGELKERNDRLDQARLACEELVKKSLNDPDSARFQDYRTYYAEEIAPAQFRVDVQLSAKNGFNATRATLVECRVLRSGAKWSALALKQRRPLTP
jgi:hypothetical protein